MPCKSRMLACKALPIVCRIPRRHLSSYQSQEETPIAMVIIDQISFITRLSAFSLPGFPELLLSWMEQRTCFWLRSVLTLRLHVFCLFLEPGGTSRTSSVFCHFYPLSVFNFRHALHTKIPPDNQSQCHIHNKKNSSTFYPETNLYHSLDRNKTRNYSNCHSYKHRSSVCHVKSWRCIRASNLAEPKIDGWN